MYDLLRIYAEMLKEGSSSDYYQRNRAKIMAKQRQYYRANRGNIARRQRRYRRQVNMGAKKVRRRQKVGNSFIYTGYHV